MESAVAGGIERGAEVQFGAGTAAVVDEQDLARIGAFGGEEIVIVAGERIGGVDADFAFAETVGGFESQEFDLRAAVLGDVHGFALQLAAVEEQRHVAFRGGRAEAGDGGLDLDALGIEDAARGDYVFDGPILFGSADWMEDQRGAWVPGAGRRSRGAWRISACRSPDGLRAASFGLR